MKLSSITAGVSSRPLRLIIHGAGGVGKSTFLAGAPDVVFLPIEDGLANIDVPKFPKAESFADVLAAVDELTNSQHSFKNLAIDSLDWLETLVHADVAREGGVKAVDDVDFAKLYGKIPLKWRELIVRLEKLQRIKGMGVLLISHSAARIQKNAEGNDYQTVDLKLLQHAKANSLELWVEWADVVGYATLEISSDKGKAKTSGARILRCHPNPAYRAKTRFPVPDRLPLEWGDFEVAVKAGLPVDMTALVASIKDLAATSEDPESALGYLSAAGSDATKLLKLENWLKGKQK